MTPNKKLFRAIVILGAAMTQNACIDTKCGARHHCEPPAPDAVANTDANTHDAGPGDAMTDGFIAIL